MTAQTIPKMSVIAQYDDLCRYYTVLTRGCEDEFKTCLLDQRKWFLRQEEDKSRIIALEAEVKKLQNEKMNFESQKQHMKKRLDREINIRRYLERDKGSMERQIALIKEVLLSEGNTMDRQMKEKLFLLSNSTFGQQESHNKLPTIEESIGPLLSPSDFDDTEENIDLSSRLRKRRSTPNRRSSGDHSQRKRRSKEIFDIQSDEIDKFGINVDTTPKRKGVNFRVCGEPNSPEMPTPEQVLRSDSEQARSLIYNLQADNTGTHSSSTPIGCYSTEAKLSQTHTFVSKKVITKDKVCPCGRLISFWKPALKCIDCRILCHPECKEKCSLTCIPSTPTPTKGIKIIRPLLLSSEVFQPQNETHEITPAPVAASRLGPIYASGQKPKNFTVGRIPLTPRSSKTRRRQFFTSPLTK